MPKEEEEEIAELMFQATIRKHGNTFGINIPTKEAEKFGIDYGDEALVTIKLYSKDTLQQDFVSLFNEQQRTKVLEEGRKRREKTKKLFELWKKERLETATFLPSVTKRWNVRLDKDEPFTKPELIYVCTQENIPVELKISVAKELQRKGAGRILRIGIEDKDYYGDFKNWLNRRNEYTEFVEKNKSKLDQEWKKQMLEQKTKTGIAQRKEDFYRQKFREYKKAKQTA